MTKFNNYRFPIYSSKDNCITLETVQKFVDTSKTLEWDTSGRILVIALIQLENGDVKRAYRVLKNNLNEILLNAGGSLEVYYDGEDVHAEEVHKNGTNFYTYRELKENTQYQKLLEKIYYQKAITNKEIKKYTSSLDEYMYAIYGV